MTPAPDNAEALGAGQALSLLRALADPIRLQVMQELASGERCVCELTAELALAQSKLSFHLKVLKQAGLLSSRQQGRWIYYSLRPQSLERLQSWLGQLATDCGQAAPRCP
ncbi:MAG: metalloregulator ArsR/SmtB family transcription factor [Synechococcaceae cyanobacterium]|nr:metalloregulator ArsR/SmtB family transcription factor [Synechococcaceae cyanobacterium]